MKEFPTQEAYSGWSIDLSDGGSWMVHGEDESGGRVIGWTRYGAHEIRVPFAHEVGVFVNGEDMEMAMTALDAQDYEEGDGYWFPELETCSLEDDQCPECGHEWPQHSVNYWAQEPFDCNACVAQGASCKAAPPRPPGVAA